MAKVKSKGTPLDNARVLLEDAKALAADANDEAGLAQRELDRAKEARIAADRAYHDSPNDETRTAALKARDDEHLAQTRVAHAGEIVAERASMLRAAQVDHDALARDERIAELRAQGSPVAVQNALAPLASKLVLSLFAAVEAATAMDAVFDSDRARVRELESLQAHEPPLNAGHLIVELVRLAHRSDRAFGHSLHGLRFLAEQGLAANLGGLLEQVLRAPKMGPGAIEHEKAILAAIAKTRTQHAAEALVESELNAHTPAPARSSEESASPARVSAEWFDR